MADHIGVVKMGQYQIKKRPIRPEGKQGRPEN